ncbi:MAG TPA: ATP-binding protein, partial [Patescibacteria group bacterium]|nr:ATP-binding protein [Patescibacteria group bacterium]
GTVTVKARPKKERVDIDIIDTGIGIPKKEINNLFDKFNRAKNAVNIYGNGSGLGLFVVKKIIDCHTKDAKVYVKESELNKGTTFTVSLPTVKES